jgi:hypothetical protein
MEVTNKHKETAKGTALENTVGISDEIQSLVKKIVG